MNSSNSTILAILVLAAVAVPTWGEIVYTPVNTVVSANGRYPIDINHDGVIDFILQSNVDLVRCQFGNGGYWKVTVQAGGGGVVGTPDNAAALLIGVQVGSSQTYNADRLIMSFFSFGYCGRYVQGEWFNVPNRFLGLEFQVSTASSIETHYGWAKVSDVGYVDERGNLQVTTLLSGFAYETVAGRAVITGQVSGVVQGTDGR